MANLDLPQDILIEIFSRLPTKSVGRFKILSKSWQTRLSTTNFVKKHLIARQQAKENVILTLRRGQLYIITSPTSNDEVSDYRHMSFEWLCVIDSCNGLVLLWGGLHKLLLVNPLTLKHLTIPEQGMKSGDVLYGFGYDCCTDDYKVVQLTCFSPNKENQTNVVDVYSVKNRVWKRVSGNPFPAHFPSRFRIFGNGVLVDGKVHWLISNYLDCNCIAAFDLSNEVFREISMPKGFVKKKGNIVDGSSRQRISCWLSIVDRCLTIIDNYGNGGTYIWMMKEYGVVESWVRFHIEADSRFESILATLCFLKDGEILSITDKGHLFACDLKGGTVRNMIHRRSDGKVSYGISFVDSLVSPE